MFESCSPSILNWETAEYCLLALSFVHSPLDCWGKGGIEAFVAFMLALCCWCRLATISSRCSLYVLFTVCEIYVVTVSNVVLYDWQENSEVRAAAFALFGDLAVFGSHTSKEQFLDQIHTNFVSFLLHLNDHEIKVRQVCETPQPSPLSVCL